MKQQRLALRPVVIIKIGADTQVRIADCLLASVYLKVMSVPYFVAADPSRHRKTMR